MIRTTITCLLTVCLWGHYVQAQGALPESLSLVKEKIQSVQYAEGEVTLTTDIDFINMPQKKADIVYTKGKPLTYESDNFIFIPRKGLDFSWNNLFDYDFIAVDRGTEQVEENTWQTFHIIPNDKRADFAIMTLAINLDSQQIMTAEIATKKEGTFNLIFSYDNNSPLPTRIEASFEMEKVKIPLNFMGNDTQIDRKSMRAEGNKTGQVFLDLKWSEIQVD
jgi:hypothetical protein